MMLHRNALHLVRCNIVMKCTHLRLWSLLWGLTSPGERNSWTPESPRGLRLRSSCIKELAVCRHLFTVSQDVWLSSHLSSLKKQHAHNILWQKIHLVSIILDQFQILALSYLTEWQLQWYPGMVNEAFKHKRYTKILCTLWPQLICFQNRNTDNVDKSRQVAVVFKFAW